MIQFLIGHFRELYYRAVCFLHRQNRIIDSYGDYQIAVYPNQNLIILEFLSVIFVYEFTFYSKQENDGLVPTIEIGRELALNEPSTFRIDRVFPHLPYVLQQYHEEQISNEVEKLLL